MTQYRFNVMDITLFLQTSSNCAPANIVRQKYSVSCLYKILVRIETGLLNIRSWPKIPTRIFISF